MYFFLYQNFFRDFSYNFVDFILCHIAKASLSANNQTFIELYTVYGIDGVSGGGKGGLDKILHGNESSLDS
jgi:hypothetical protein